MIKGMRRIFSVFISKNCIQYFYRKSYIQHSNQNSLFTFEEPQLDAESSSENIRDTNIRNFLRRFWIRYQSGISSFFQKMTFLVLQVVLFFKNPPRRATETMKLLFITSPYDSPHDIYVWYLHITSPYDIYVWYMPMTYKHDIHVCTHDTHMIHIWYIHRMFREWFGYNLGIIWAFSLSPRNQYMTLGPKFF